ncbi:MAG TPA: ATP-binding protein [Rhizomicrobium sp.]|nr:ATP-binding protein [Rhizomicrobium sp.]
MPRRNVEELEKHGHVIPFSRAKNREEADLGVVLIELVEHCRRQIAPGITLSLSAKLGPGFSITMPEAVTLGMVVDEIVSNAYRYSHPEGASVEVTMECSITKTGEIVIDIGDDGVGLPPDFAEWRDAGNGMVSVRHALQKIGAALNLTSDDLGLRFQIILRPRRPRATPARGNFVWL